jgi:hypothetical protein
MDTEWNHKVFNVSAKDLDALALEIFRFQYGHNSIYKNYVDALRINPATITQMQDIPFLPIRFFKSQRVVSGEFEPVATFESSGTTGSINSKHFIKDLSIYRESFTKGFELFYGPANDWCIIGLLPSYLERSNSSLVVMVDELVKQSNHPQSGFYLNEYDKLVDVLQQLEAKGQRTLLIGVSFALLDLAARHPISLRHTTIMETGGMKGRRKEMIRQEMHDVLKRSFNVSAIHSEYGMTELLSQAYSNGNGIFQCPPWMKIVLREEEDPLTIKEVNENKPVSGVINVIDLANIHSCSFIATDDAGRLYADGSFEVLGRIDNSDMRGCSLMAI